MNNFKSFLKNYAHNLFVILKGFCASFIGFANVTALLFGYNCFINVKASDGWVAIGYFLASIAMIVLSIVVSYIGGIFVSRYQKFSKKK